MISRLVRKFSSMFYSYPRTPDSVVPQGQFQNLKIALVTDYFTTECLSVECRIKSLTLANYKDVIETWKPDLVFVESAFHGEGGAWRYELAKQSRLLRQSKAKAIFCLVDFARAHGIPTVFWNKDDGAYFDAFINVACAFDYVFTTDKECVDHYMKRVAPGVPVNTLTMPYQPQFHAFTGFDFVENTACFTGSYYRRILDGRRQFLDMLFQATADAGLKLNVYDRNHDRLSRHLEFRFPKKPHMRFHKSVPHRATAAIYKRHVVSLNVNSVTDSETMCSRRLMEILACGGIAVTNPSRAVDRYFRDYCHVVSTREEAQELFSRLRHGASREDMERAEAGATYVRQHHTWAQRLEELCAIVKI